MAWFVLLAYVFGSLWIGYRVVKAFTFEDKIGKMRGKDFWLAVIIVAIVWPFVIVFYYWYMTFRAKKDLGI